MNFSAPETKAPKAISGKGVDRPENFFNTPRIFRSPESKRKQARVIAELIEFKRTKAEKEQDRKRLFFAIGLAISLALVIAAFEWRFYDRTNKIDLGSNENTQFEDVLEIPLTEQTPPPPPQQMQAVVITEVSDEIEIEQINLNFDVEITESMAISEPIVMDEPLPEEEVDEVFVIVETRPEPIGGMQAFYAYLSTNLKYPKEARQMGISGRVYVQFIVEKNGDITNVEVVKGIGAGCDEEAVKVLQNAPAWSPGKQRGRPVKVKMTIPIFFTLAG